MKKRTEVDLRLLSNKDAKFMLEWMHDVDVVQYLKTDFLNKTIYDCLSFIKESQNNKDNLHLAVVNEKDEYLGTISLKHINDEKAELGIVIRKCAMGKGYSSEALFKIFNIGKEKYNISHFYWCVDPKNERALRFYEKNGFKRYIPFQKIAGYTVEEIKNYYWYKYDIPK